MMEAMEDTSVEAAVLWLVQTILANLLLDKLDAWLRHVGLTDDTEKLRYAIENVEAVVTAAKGRAAGNKPLVRSLARLKELLYDTDDIVDELDYFRLQYQVEGGVDGAVPLTTVSGAMQLLAPVVTLASAIEPEGIDGDGTEQVDASRENTAVPSIGKKRSKAWDNFRITEETDDGKPVKAECKHCGTQVRCETTKGTSVLHNHLKSEKCKRKCAETEQTPNPPRAGDDAHNGATVSTLSESRKRMRINEMSTHNTAANAHPWNKTKFINRIRKTTHRLQNAISDVRKLYRLDASLNLCRSTFEDPCQRTSSIVQHKIYGRDAEKNSIIKMMMTEDKSDSVTVLPIVGIGGIGKTALAQLVYNDSSVENRFKLRIWVWVSKNIDQVRLTIEMLDFVSQENHQGLNSLAKLQEILVSHVTSKRFLLILDDVWDSMDDYTWNNLLSPLKHESANGNMILVTTRKLSIAKRIGTVEPIKLGALQNDDFWLLFKACAFGDDNHEGCIGINIIGQRIAEKLYGNPLAAETAGMLLRVNLTIDHWTNILKYEKWKSLQLSRGIMHALKPSYDQLPYYLQQCFLYSCIFPNNYRFCRDELVNIWISQGFVISGSSTERFEDIGRDYLADLIDSGFVEQVERKENTPKDKACYVMCAIMHDYARLLSRTECATIDGLEFNSMPSTIRHLSILTDATYHEDHHGSMLRSTKFKEKLQRKVTSVRKLRTLILIGKYDEPFFLQSFQDIFQKAQRLRMVQISGTYTDFNSFMCNFVYSTHLRYIKLQNRKFSDFLPQSMWELKHQALDVGKLYHLQALDFGKFRDHRVPNNMNRLVSLRHLTVPRYSSIAGIGKMTSLQELHDFSVQNCSDFNLTQLQSMSGLLQLGVSQLENVATRDEASCARLRDKQHLEKLHLSWSLVECNGEASSGTPMDIEGEEESSLMDHINNSRSSEHIIDTAKEVLDGLEPHHNLKHLHIMRYLGATSPGWLATSGTCLQTLHLEYCQGWKTLPPLERLPFLTKLKLRNMQKVKKVSIPSLEKLVLVEMPNLERCSCGSVKDLNSSLRVLKIEGCRVLKLFPLFESCEKLKIGHMSWLPHLRKLIIHDCPILTVSRPLPPASSTACKLSIGRVSTLPTMEGVSNGEWQIGADPEIDGRFDEDSNQLMKLDDKILQFHSLWALTRLNIVHCRNLSSISLEGLRQLISLKSLDIISCPKLFSSNVLPEHTHDNMADANCNALPSLKSLHISCSEISGNWLYFLMLRHAQALEEFCLSFDRIEELSIEEEEIEVSNPGLAMETSPSVNSGISVINSSRNRLMVIPSNLISSVKEISFFMFSQEKLQLITDFSELTSLEKLDINGCDLIDENSDQGNKIGSCNLQNVTRLKELRLLECEIQSLELYSYTALEELYVQSCPSLATLKVPQALRNLRVTCCPRLSPLSECLLTQGYDIRPQLESLVVDDCSVLTRSFCMHLTTLQRLVLMFVDRQERLTVEQEIALQQLTSLQELGFHSSDFQDLPVWLHRLSSLKRMEISLCSSILGLPEKGLPPWLEELEVWGCSKELKEQCRMLATSKLKVRIDCKYVN